MTKKLTQKITGIFSKGRHRSFESENTQRYVYYRDNFGVEI